jgi:small-conductance mechanosensitive channel
MHKHVWLHANIKLVPCIILFTVGVVISYAYGNVRNGNVDHKLMAAIGVIIFVVFATAFLHILTRVLHGLLASHRLGSGRAAAIRFILRTFGYIAILLATLQLIGIPVGRILLGSAVLGIILGVAAQQALANFFASFVLILSHPFTVGEQITLNSGALGGQYDGTVIDIGLTHTRLEEKDGNVIFLPNATILSGAAIRGRKHSAPSSSK